MTWPMLRRLILAAIPIAVVAAGAVAFQAQTTAPSTADAQTTWAPMYGNLGAEYTSAITAQLTSDGIPFRLKDGGSVLLAPQAVIVSVRAVVAEKVLSRAPAGLNNFDPQRVASWPCARHAFETSDRQRHLRRDLIGRSVAKLREYASAHHNEIRVLGEDGSCSYLRSDLRLDRIDVYIQRGVIIWAANF